MGLFKAFVYSDRYGVKAARFLLFFAALAQLENARASTPVKTPGCFAKVMGASRAAGKAAAATAKTAGNAAKEVGKSLVGYGQEVKDTKGLRLLVKDPIVAPGVEERWHGVWRRRAPTEAVDGVKDLRPLDAAAADANVVEGAAAEATPAKSLVGRVGDHIANAGPRLNDTIQAKPRAWSRKLFRKGEEPWGGDYDFHPLYAPSAILRAATKRAFGKEKQFATLPTLVAFSVATAESHRALNEQGKMAHARELYAHDVKNDVRYDDILSDEKNRKISHEETLRRIEARYDELVARQELGKKLKAQFDAENDPKADPEGKRNPLFQAQDLKGFDEAEVRELLVKANPLVEAFDDYRYRDFGQEARKEIKQANGNAEQVVSAIQKWELPLKYLQAQEAKLHEALAANEFRPGLPIDDLRLKRVQEFISVDDGPAGPTLRYPQFGEQARWISDELPPTAPKGFIYPSGTPTKMNPMDLVGVPEDRVEAESLARWQRVSDLVGLNEIRYRTLHDIEESLKDAESIPEEIRSTFASEQGRDPLVEKLDQLWRAKKINRRDVQNTLMEYTHEKLRLEEYRLIGMRPLKEVPGSSGRYTSELKTIQDVRDQILEKMPR